MSEVSDLRLFALHDFPMVREGDDIASLIRRCAAGMDFTFEAGDVIVIAQKIISKAEGRLVALKDIEPSPEAFAYAEKTAKDPRLVELVLRESDEVVRYRENVLVVAHRLGFVHANAGIDQSNVKRDDDEVCALLLPEDSDKSAEQIRRDLMQSLGVDLGVIINDSMGRAWRVGTVGQAIGCAGVRPLIDKRGDTDLYGRVLEITEVAVGDEIAAAASFVMGQGDEGCPVVVVRGAGGLVVQGEAYSSGVKPLLREKQFDLFRN